MKKRIYFTGLFFVLFAVWTAVVCLVDRKAIGPLGSVVGLAGINNFFADLIGVNFALYNLTDLLSVVPIAFALGFSVLGFTKLIKGKSIKKVDRSLLVLGAFYAVLGVVYFLFELVVVNFRPVLIDGHLEGSYPSSTTLLVLCVMPTVAFELLNRMKGKAFKVIVFLFILAFTVFMVAGRIMAGVHWFSDIVGGALCSCFLISGYFTALYGVRLQK